MRGGTLKNKIFNIFVLILFIAAIFVGCTPAPSNGENNLIIEKPSDGEVLTETEDLSEVDEQNNEQSSEQNEDYVIDEEGTYTAPEDVALYIHTYNKLPSNFITKKKAMELGWESSEGNLWEVTDQMSIGGDVFGNREGNLPKKDGRRWFECDVNYEGGFRGAERIVYSNDGLIYYTDDHYKTFSQFY